MEMPEEPPVAEPEPPEPPGEPKASRTTTIVLIVSLVLVVVIAGVLGTVAVLMTRSPDSPLLGAKPPQRLATPIHFAPVRETKPAPCPGVAAALDEKQTTCYLLEDGVTVESVQRIQSVRESDGTYSVRIAIAPKFQDKMTELIDELVPDQRQVAVVLLPKTVVAAPFVTQGMNGDSLSITGFTQEEADALAERLLGTQSAGATGVPTTGSTSLADTGPPDTGLSNTGTPPGGTPPGGTPPGGTPPATAPVGGSPTGAAQGDLDPRYTSCKEAAAAGYGPYTKGVHPEYAWYTDVDSNGVACNSADIR
jgi:hypothetical protein